MEFALKYTIFFYVAALVSVLSAKNVNSRMDGDKKAQPGQFPFMVSIMSLVYGQSFCDGTIIGNRWVLTTAQCLDKLRLLEEGYIVVGTNNLLDKDSVKFNITNAFVHPYFYKTTRRNNIGLIKIDGEFTTTDAVKSVEIVDVTYDELSISVVYWNSAQLEFTNSQILSPEECVQDLDDWVENFTLGEGEICAYHDSDASVCIGYEGSPLVADGKLVGIVSYPVMPCSSSFPDIYTYVAYYKDWISEVLQKN